MRPCLVIILAILFFVHTVSSQDSRSMKLKLCTSRKTVSVQIFINPDEDDALCQCQTAVKENPSSTRGDYVHTQGVGSHRLHTSAKTWNEARKVCNEEDGHLAIINSRAEENVLVSRLKKAKNSIKNAANTEEAFLGIHDFFAEGDWVTVLGGSLYATGYAHWSPTYWGGQPDNKDNNQNCGALINQGGMDDVHCHERFAFFCELPLYCA